MADLPQHLVAKLLTLCDSLGNAILRPSELRSVFRSGKSSLDLPRAFPFADFEGLLLEEGVVSKIVLPFPSRRQTRYVFGRASVYALAMSVAPEGYFTHHTAMSLHDLTDQLPRTIYLNAEQTPKPWTRGALAQDRIDLAFKRKPRVSSNVATFEDYRICLLSGMNTGNLGATSVDGPKGEQVRVANLARTLIDITVRPFYSGGVFEVLEAYRRAKKDVDVSEVVGMLKDLSYVYPYHQAIGFYMEKAGCYTPDELQLLADLPQEYDFYVTFQIRNPQYSPRWRLFFPEGL